MLFNNINRLCCSFGFLIAALGPISALAQSSAEGAPSCSTKQLTKFQKQLAGQSKAQAKLAAKTARISQKLSESCGDISAALTAGANCNLSPACRANFGRNGTITAISFQTLMNQYAAGTFNFGCPPLSQPQPQNAVVMVQFAQLIQSLVGTIVTDCPPQC